MKTHSQLADYLLGTSFNGIPQDQIVRNILNFTSPGVAAEGDRAEVRDSAPSGAARKLTDSLVSTASVNPTWRGTQEHSGFKFGAGSEKELVGVNEDLVRVTRRALDYCAIDFVVFDGIRTFKEQQNHVRNGTSKTMASKHLDGLAVDLVPYIGGRPVWDWNGCYRIALAMDRAATELGVAHKIRWGGAWDRTLADFGGDQGSYEQEVESYKKRHAGSDFIDGPHFEWIK